MIVIIVFFMLLGCSILINTSEKAILSNRFIVEQLIQKQPTVFKIVGCFILLISLFLCSFYFGITSGVLFWLIALLAILSLLILLKPLKLISYKTIVLLFVLLLTIENIFF